MSLAGARAIGFDDPRIVCAHRSMNLGSHGNSSPDQVVSIANVLARVRLRRPLTPPCEKTQAPERGGGSLEKNVNPSPSDDAIRGTENQRRYWKGGKRQPAKTGPPGGSGSASAVRARPSLR